MVNECLFVLKMTWLGIFLVFALIFFVDTDWGKVAQWLRTAIYRCIKRW